MGLRSMDERVGIGRVLLHHQEELKQPPVNNARWF